jgi:hypothetical protein
MGWGSKFKKKFKRFTRKATSNPAFKVASRISPLSGMIDEYQKGGSKQEIFQRGLDPLRGGKTLFGTSGDERRKKDERDREFREAIGGLSAGAAEGRKTGIREAESLFGPAGNLSSEMMAIRQKRKAMAGQGLDAAAMQKQSNQFNVNKQQLKGQQASQNVRGGLASGQQAALQRQYDVQRAALDVGMQKENLGAYEGLINRQLSASATIPLAYAELESGSKMNQALMNMKSAHDEPSGFLSGLNIF